MSHYTIEQQKVLLANSSEKGLTEETDSIQESSTAPGIGSDQHDVAHILLSELAFDAYYMSDEEEVDTFDTSNLIDFSSPEESTKKIQLAEKLIENFDYQEGLSICLHALAQDYDNMEAHRLILETFNSLGFRN